MFAWWHRHRGERGSRHRCLCSGEGHVQWTGARGCGPARVGGDGTDHGRSAGHLSAIGARFCEAGGGRGRGGQARRAVRVRGYIEPGSPPAPRGAPGGDGPRSSLPPGGGSRDCAFCPRPCPYARRAACGSCAVAPRRESAGARCENGRDGGRTHPGEGSFAADHVRAPRTRALVCACSPEPAAAQCAHAGARKSSKDRTGRERPSCADRGGLRGRRPTARFVGCRARPARDRRRGRRLRVAGAAKRAQRSTRFRSGADCDPSQWCMRTSISGERRSVRPREQSVCCGACGTVLHFGSSFPVPGRCLHSPGAESVRGR